jgi:hypothetical protein
MRSDFMSVKFDVFAAMKQGMDYADYLKVMQSRADQAVNHPDDEHFQATPMNLRRSQRISRTYQVPDEICRHINKIADKQYWLILTEPWCGDSSQTLPYIVQFATCNSNIELKILLRDEHLEIMDHYLTDGNRGIPKLIAFGCCKKPISCVNRSVKPLCSASSSGWGC